MINSFYDLSVYILGELPTQFQFLNAILAYVFGLIFFFVVVSPFIYLFKKLTRL